MAALKSSTSASPSFSTQTWFSIAVAALGAGAAFVAVLAWVVWPNPEPPLVNRFDYRIPDDQLLRATGRPILALAPDGRHFVYNAEEGLYLRSLDALDARLIRGTEPVDTTPIFSPDGQSLAYWEFGSLQLKRVAAIGGAPIVVGSFEENPYGMSWNSEGTILVGQPDGIYRVSANGGVPERIIASQPEELFYGPQFLPDGDSVLFSLRTNTSDWDEAQVVVQSLSTGKLTTLVARGSDARYLPTGHIVYAVETRCLRFRSISTSFPHRVTRLQWRKGSCAPPGGSLQPRTMTYPMTERSFIYAAPATMSCIRSSGSTANGTKLPSMCHRRVTYQLGFRPMGRASRSIH